MKNISWSRTIAVGLASLFVFCLASSLQADDHRTCSLRGAAGAYGFSWTGTGLPGDPATTGAGTFTLDRHGNVTDGKQTVNFAVDGVFRYTMNGTYSVNSDCTGSFSVNLYDPDGSPAVKGFPFDAVWIDSMKEIRLISLDNGLFFILDAKKLSGNGD